MTGFRNIGMLTGVEGSNPRFQFRFHFMTEVRRAARVGGPLFVPGSEVSEPRHAFRIGTGPENPWHSGGKRQETGMFSASKLSPEQVASLKQRAAEGASMSDLQRHLKDDLGITITYMDTRFLVLDLGIELIEEPKEEPKEEPAENAAPVPTGAVNVTMDTIAMPGALVSGKVTFSDGETAVWMLDQTGRPGLDPDTPGYRPSQEDIMEFQTQLRSLLQKSGM